MSLDKTESGFSIPGLVSIEENESGYLDVILEDDKIEEFYNFLGLQVGDEIGLQKLMSEALAEYLGQKGEEDDSRE